MIRCRAPVQGNMQSIHLAANTLWHFGSAPESFWPNFTVNKWLTARRDAQAARIAAAHGGGGKPPKAVDGRLGPLGRACSDAGSRRGTAARASCLFALAGACERRRGVEPPMRRFQHMGPRNNGCLAL